MEPRVKELPVATLRATPGLQEVPDEALAALCAAARSRQLADGEALFSAGDEFRSEIYLLAKGAIEIRRVAGRVERPDPGYFLGLSGYLAEAPYASTAVALGPATVGVLGDADLNRLERAHPALFDAINRLIAIGLRERSAAAAPVSGALAEPVRSVMSTPLSTCSADAPLRAAIGSMAEADVGSLVVLDEAGQPAGLLTHRSVAATLLQGTVDPDTSRARDAVREATTISASSPVWKAQDLLERRHIKHLIVMEDGRPAGLLSQTDLVRLLASRRGGFAARVGEAENIEALARQREEIGALAVDALDTNRRARLAVRTLSECHLAIQRRCIELTLAAAGEPPLPFAFIIMGSGGRREMMLDPDQDNGLIITDSPDYERADVRSWFDGFADSVNRNLATVGYRLCPGDIMARNPAYRHTLSQWREKIARLARSPNDKAARWSNIVFDFTTQFGEDDLTRALRAHLHEVLAKKPLLLQHMVDDDAQGRAPINWFNRLVTTGERDGRETVDVKRNGLRIVANAARILALRARVSHSNTSDRIGALVRRGVLTADFGATVSAAYDELLDILLSHQISQWKSGDALDKEVAPESLPAPAREALRVSMRAVKRFQEVLQDEIGRTGDL
jgi:CBS domain-containing protein